MIEFKDGNEIMINSKLYRLIAPRGKEPRLKRIYRIEKLRSTGARKEDV